METCSSDDLNLFDTVAAPDHTVTMSCCDPVNWLSNVLQPHKTLSQRAPSMLLLCNLKR